MNVDDIIAHSLEFVLDELRLVHVVFAEHESKHWFYIKLCTRDSYSAVAHSLRSFIVGTEEVHTDIKILLPAVSSPEDITNFHLHILGGIC